MAEEPIEESAATTTSVVEEEDKYVWLEDVEAPECLDFAKSANAKCLEALGDPTEKEGGSYDRILRVLESDDRIPHVSSHGIDDDGNRIVYNFWKDKESPKGIWRKTTLESYQNNEKPEWTTVLDVDELAKKDGISWVWKGSRGLPRSRDLPGTTLVSRTLLSLSRGGSDAIHLKEFDLHEGAFVEDQPFQIGEAKTRASYKSRNILLVGSDFGPGSLTDSGYPRVVKEWVRGTPLEDAPIVFEGEQTDVAVNGYIADERTWGGDIWQIHSRSMTFYTSKYYMAKLTEDHLKVPDERPSGLAEPEFKELELPEDADIDYVGNLLFIVLRSDWTPKEPGYLGYDTSTTTYKRGSVIYCSLPDFWMNGKSAVEYQVFFEPTERTAYEYFTVTKNYLVLSTMDNVKSKLTFYKLIENGSAIVPTKEFPPSLESVSVRPLDATSSDDFWYTTSGYLTPSALYLADATKVDESSTTEVTDDSAESPSFVTSKLKTLPKMYNSDGLAVEQRTATSKDGTQVPYFIVYPKDIVDNKKGNTPTLLYGYGGFEISLGPHYVATSGLAWLEKGGVYVEANIRGGGEFGPGWHQAALKANRNKAYEDFIAVAEHLMESGICSPSTLAIRGGSNGGLLMGNMYTMRPDLFGAIHCAVPLLDMKRFHTLLAGASWMAEYGNPDTDDWENFLYKYSPYHNLDMSGDTTYPPMLVTTSTRDDR